MICWLNNSETKRRLQTHLFVFGKLLTYFGCVFFFEGEKKFIINETIIKNFVQKNEI